MGIGRVRALKQRELVEHGSAIAPQAAALGLLHQMYALGWGRRTVRLVFAGVDW